VSGKPWKVWVVPGGLLLALMAGFVYSPAFAQVAPSLGFFYVAVFAAGLFLAWRFHSSRVLFSLLTLLLAHRAVDFFSAGQAHSAPGHIAVTLAALLIPLNFIMFAVMRERGLVIPGIAPRAGLLFVESVVVAVWCRPENNRLGAHRPSTSGIALWLLLPLVGASVLFVWRYLQTRKPIEPGFLWSTAAVFCWLEFASVGKMADAYVATAGLILAASLIETSYVLAYYDELTGIRGRRAFNEALLSLDEQYTIAIVDIDHFKKFNDTYGHDVGDQVLRMVAACISKVSGSGQAFRCGGEEFAIIFRGIPAKEAFQHLELLRQLIQRSMFQLRSADRRAVLRTGETDRRKAAKKKAAPSALSQVPDRLSVTVSIGAAEPSTRNRQPEQVIQAADQSLYRAKQKGRNRVELAAPTQLRLEKVRRARASSQE
jgi:diguanylate cyclase (GGDEF)-like protein